MAISGLTDCSTRFDLNEMRRSGWSGVAFFASIAFVLLIGMPLAEPAHAQTVTYIHTDALGSVVAESDASGNVIKRYNYEPYGAAVGEGPVDGPSYTGHVSDASTGLSYMQQRYMDPQLGVFLSIDPVSPYGGSVGQFNRYRYANSNPYRFKDPDGRESGAAFRVVNGLTNGGPVVPPPQSPDDWLGPAIGYSLAGILAAPAVGFGGSWALANPSTAGSFGSAVADMMMGDAIGGASLSSGSVLLYRVVDAAEMNSLKQLGHFIASPNGDSVKRFLGNKGDAEDLASAFTKGFGSKHTVVEGQAPSSLVNSAERTPFNDTGRTMQSIGIPSSQVHKVTCTGSHIKQTSC
ncbi:RHS repeat domain-containing protein [Stenotrophomonas rhizophila]|uniref:RHS repeat domain-containing protein n=1 Tax=Stenotrophomonas rhizophila TaxID=216778 RepID=UPI0039C9FA65